MTTNCHFLRSLRKISERTSIREGKDRTRFGAPLRFLATATLATLALALIPRFSHAAKISLGSAAAMATSSADHAKWGPSIALAMFEGSNWSFWAEGFMLMTTLTSVNPGAGNNPSAPDQRESYSGQTTVFAETMLRTPWNVLGSQFSTGLIWYSPDLSATGSNSYLPAVGVKARWGAGKNGDTGFSFEPNFAFGIYPLKFSPIALLGVPAVDIVWRFSKPMSLTLAPQAVLAFATNGMFSILPVATLRVAYAW